VLRLPAGDDLLRALTGSVFASNVYPNVEYWFDRALGAGSMAVAFLVERRAPTGTGVAVIKVARPEFVRAAAETALLTIRKESVALGRLNERVPPTPFVVRFIESGDTDVLYGAQRLLLPWLVMEYVHGDTLEVRIDRSVRQTGSAFDPIRAAACVEAIASGLDAVHSVNVIHRDIKPNNVLCCGTPPDEAFKISDFGVARPVGLRQTFMQGSMGTPGYASPEQILMDEKNIGAASDVFSLDVLDLDGRGALRRRQRHEGARAGAEPAAAEHSRHQRARRRSAFASERVQRDRRRDRPRHGARRP
jgi:serine/threonine protein kinase